MVLKKLNWRKLKNNKCPQCGKDISMTYNEAKDMFICKCGFTISNDRYKEIISDMNIRDVRRLQDISSE